MILMLKDQKVASLLFGSSGNRVSGNRQRSALLLRMPLGEKGVGRLAAHKLGRKFFKDLSDLLEGLLL
jgi:hypothetical protein